MNATQALKQARKRWGKNAAVRDGRTETSDATRAEGLAERDRLRSTLTPDEQKTPENRRAIREAAARSFNRRYSVGEVISLAGLFSMFKVCGEGDTWEEAFAKADEKSTI